MTCRTCVVRKIVHKVLYLLIQIFSLSDTSALSPAAKHNVWRFVNSDVLVMYLENP
jgi:hypothetical protein